MISNALTNATTVGSIICSDLVKQKYAQMPDNPMKAKATQSSSGISTTFGPSSLARSSKVKAIKLMTMPPMPAHQSKTKEWTWWQKLIEMLRNPENNADDKAMATPT